MKAFLMSLALILCFSPLNTYGECIEGDCVNGKGTYIFSNGSKYVGQWRDGMMNGQGTYTFYDGYIYEGMWEHGNRDGQGAFILPDGRKFVGQWEDGKLIKNLISYETHRPWLEETAKGASKGSEEKAETGFSQQKSKQRGSLAKQGTYPYTVHVCSFKSKEKSSGVAMKLREEGIPAFTCPAHIPGKGKYYRIFVGYYRNLEETREAASKLKDRKDLYPLEAKLPYAIQVGIFDSDQEAKMLEADFLSKALLTYSIPDRNNIQVLVGAFRTKKEAAILTKELLMEGFQAKVIQR